MWRHFTLSILEDNADLFEKKLIEWLDRLQLKRRYQPIRLRQTTSNVNVIGVLSEKNNNLQGKFVKSNGIKNAVAKNPK